MAEAFTSYTLENDVAFKAALTRAQAVVSDLKVPFGLILADFYKSQQAIWKLKGPGKYPPFSGKNIGEMRAGPLRYPTATRKPIPENANALKQYQYYKLKKYGFDYPLLVATGRLAASLSGPSNRDSVSSIGPLHMYFGTSTPYAIYHQSDKARKRIPLRKFLFIGPEAPSFATSEQMGRLGRWNNILNDYVLKALKRSGQLGGGNG